MGDFINSAPLFVVILLLVVGFALLVKGADFFVAAYCRKEENNLLAEKERKCTCTYEMDIVNIAYRLLPKYELKNDI